jgi:Mrp family chromosome partitioning ATPase/uncharacterized protein involved in exopolysaccharide biosynthesis
MYRPTYRSSALLRIAYTLPAVMRETDQNGAKPMFDTFMTSQRLLITSRRVIDQAMLDPIWKATGRQLSDDPDRYFSEHLLVDIKPRSEYIEISVIDRDPNTAQAAVTAISNAYYDFYMTLDRQQERLRSGVLDDKQGELQTKITSLSTELDKMAEEYGSLRLDQLADAATSRVVRLEATLSDIRVAMAAGPEAVTAAAVEEKKPAAGPTTAPVMSVQEIAIRDRDMRVYLDEQRKCNERLRLLLEAGYGERNNAVAAARYAVEQASEQVERYAEWYRQYQAVTARGLGETRTGPIGLAGKSKEELEKNFETIQSLCKEARAEMKDLNKKQRALTLKQQELDAAREEFGQAKGRADTLKAESSLGGRLSVISSGEVPLSPERDLRLKFACGGALAGAIFPTLTVLGWGLAFGRRYRYSDEATNPTLPSVPLLGVLPSINTRGEDPANLAGASQSVHQIRVTLQSRAEQGKPHVYLVTSSSAGEGKTSLTMSLGLSLGASRLRTLIIDCDLVGRTLTRNLKSQGVEGISEAVLDGSIRQRLRRLNPHVAVMTTGKVSGVHACSISQSGLRSVLQEARRYFDVILIDSGPILGSIEAAVIAQEVDGVIFTISRGQQRGMVQRALSRLTGLGAPLIGFVFNRADAEDFQRSPYGSSSEASVSAEVARAARLGAVPARLSNFGPLVNAVAGGIPLAAQN